VVTELHPDLERVIDAVEILSPTRFSVLGETRDISDEPGNDSPARLQSLLEDDLYARMYIRPTQPRPDHARQVPVDREFLAALSHANTGRGTWQPGWTVRRVDKDGTVLASRPDITLRVARSELRVARKHIEPGAPCRVRVPKELCYMLSGYYVALGDGRANAGAHDEREPLIDDGWPRLRFYWHLTHHAAAPFIATATACLNAAKIPFQLKVVRNSSAYHRSDAGVLFLPRHDALKLGAALLQIHESVAPMLRPDVPLFTLKLANGLAVADEPSGALSFGQHRCRLIAQALWRSFSEGEHSRLGRATRLAEQFRAERLDCRHPYLGPGWPPDELASLQRAFASREMAISTSAAIHRKPTATFLDAAARIAESLCRTAHSDNAGKRCNWVGRSAREMNAGLLIPTVEALGPDVYGGSTGIALFLAHVYRLTGDGSFRRVALGAMARSIEQLRRRPADVVSPLSFYCGTLGVACVARRIGDLLDDSSLLHASDLLLEPLAGEVEKPHPLDVMSGDAGAIPALVALARRNGRCRYLYRSMAVALGNHLCQGASHRGPIWMWPPEPTGDPHTTQQALCGMSHGASGIAVALLELHRVTGNALFLEAARGAFAYEDSLFDPATSDWPDLRKNTDGTNTQRTSTSTRGWCHGAPGIALARLRAIELDPDGPANYEEMARRALGTTLGAVDENLARSAYDASLCHGLAGLLDILVIGGTQLGDARLVDRAIEVGWFLVDRHSHLIDYPSGLHSGAVTPGLMLGLAGTGHTFLRLHAPDLVPSPLLPGAA
jgi:hypothetical protein